MPLQIWTEHQIQGFMHEFRLKSMAYRLSITKVFLSLWVLIFHWNLSMNISLLVLGSVSQIFKVLTGVKIDLNNNLIELNQSEQKCYNFIDMLHIESQRWARTVWKRRLSLTIIICCSMEFFSTLWKWKLLSEVQIIVFS